MDNNKITSKISELNQVLTFHNESNLNSFDQNMNVSFMVMLMSFHAMDIESSNMSLFTPELMLNGPVSNFIAGRVEDSMHRHNYFEFTYVLDGSMYQIVEGKRYFYPTGSCCLMNRDTLHTEELSNDFTCIFFGVSADFVARMANYGNSMLFPLEQEGFDNMIYRFMNENLGSVHSNSRDFVDFIPKIGVQEQKLLVHDIFERMLHTFINPYYGATYRLQNLFFRLLEVLCNEQYYEAVHVTARSNMDSLLFARINQVLEEHHGRISNRELSEILNYDGSYLGKVVKKQTGMSLFNYSMTFTMAEAARLIEKSDKSVTEIAQTLGFSNRTHFYQIFKKFYGVTPGEYRR